MKIAFVTPGSGDNYYCQNCFRDDEFLNSLVALGQDVRKIPMYLPSDMDSCALPETPVFYGAINVYLREKLPLYKHAPTWLERAMDSPSLLRVAAKRSGSTSPSELEGMTLSLLRGEEGRQSSELEHLIQYLREEIKPDIVHLSNALLLGLAHRIKQDLGIRVVCSLQDENEWIDEMSPGSQKSVWNLMADKAVDVDLFIATSRFYATKSEDEFRVPHDKIRVIQGGINLDGYERSPLPFHPPVLGYLCRMSKYFGLGILVDAFIKLKEKSRFRDLRLHVTGGYAGPDKPFVKSLMEKLSSRGCREDVVVFKEFDKASRVKFLKSLTLLSVPVPGGEAFGAYQVEALAAGVPVVQPNVGCYPEFVDMTKGGIIYEPNDPDSLAEAIDSLLTDPEEVQRLGDQGRRAVFGQFSMKAMASNIVRIYQELT
jgi:glycosyltransferase involved in cell wall biosynthesis